MLNFYRHIYLPKRFFILFTAIIFLYVISFFIPYLFTITKIITLVFFSIVLIDFTWLYAKKILIQGNRITQPLLSLSDENKIELIIRNLSSRSWNLNIIDELPFQLQKRDFNIKLDIKPKSNEKIAYYIRPLSRGEYHFGNLNVFVKSKLGLIKRRVVIPVEAMVPVYPSIIQMKKTELFTISSIARFHGVKKMRRIGISYEFEQIKHYVRGDDVRHINWKATGKSNQLMINQFEEERAQSIYSIIDKSRIMLMPFNGLSLMDYAINSTLSISNIVLKKQDRIGLMTYSDKIGAAIKSDKKPGQLQTILNALYNQEERNVEANYEMLYYGIKQLIKSRSLLFLYSNFESIYGLNRALPILRKINKEHVLVVVFFENSELIDFSHQAIHDLKGIYTKTIVEQTINEKKLIAQELNNHGIQTVLTKPENLTIASINKYLEIKARGLI